jgi:hypothetical protein
VGNPHAAGRSGWDAFGYLPPMQRAQNIPLSESDFHCWQCNFGDDVGPAIGPEDGRQWLDRIKGE